MTFEEWWEANGPTGSANLILSTYKSWCRWSFEAGCSSMEEESKKVCLMTRGHRSFEEWKKSTIPTWNEPGDPDEWMRRAFEAGQASMDQEPEYLTADQLTEHGKYWWLPPVFIGKADVQGLWEIREWHPKSCCNPEGGLFVGPLKAPVKRKQK